MLNSFSQIAWLGFFRLGLSRSCCWSLPNTYTSHSYTLRLNSASILLQVIHTYILFLITFFKIIAVTINFHTYIYTTSYLMLWVEGACWAHSLLLGTIILKHFVRNRSKIKKFYFRPFWVISVHSFGCHLCPQPSGLGSSLHLMILRL
jgi:hypothetical protein